MAQPKSQVSIHLKMKITDAGDIEKSEVKAAGTFLQRNNLAALTYTEKIEDYGNSFGRAMQDVGDFTHTSGFFNTIGNRTGLKQLGQNIHNGWCRNCI